ncbi:SDR family NAD(P)-dependent oxidoreductase [Candidatus Kaiserbacteria bacterium]|nr:SDR family NAD(P)-dependent oxidoreductase [Candidatus Kaiserbacteria bacterium]
MGPKDSHARYASATHGKTILITGGTGSFGNATVRRLLGQDGVKKIVVFSRDEEKQHRMRQMFRDERLDFIVGDVRDTDALFHAMRGIDVIFHAAALKQVPTGEFYPLEMVKTNIIGTHNVIDAAVRSGVVQKVVLLSTDKAVYPINAMGMSKAVAEKVVMARARAHIEPTFCTVRYGNVMATRGSVIPLFIEQMKMGKPITVTNPSMTRFMLSIDDAIDLVLLAIDKGERGDLFVKKSPASTIGDLARAVVEIFGSKNGVEQIGMRAGEKLHETLLTALELARAEDLGDFYRIRNVAEYDYRKFYEEGAVNKLPADFTSENTRRLNYAETKALVASLDEVKQELAAR